jgi:C-terminal of Roc, COR, domain
LRLLWDENRFPASLHTALVSILQRFELAISLDPKQFDLSVHSSLLRGHETATVSQSEQSLLVPSLLPEVEPTTPSTGTPTTLAPSSTPEDRPHTTAVDQFRVHYRFTFVPSFFPRLLVRLLQMKTTDPPQLVVTHIWRRGIVFSWCAKPAAKPSPETNSFAVKLLLLPNARSLCIQVDVRHMESDKVRDVRCRAFVCVVYHCCAIGWLG